MAETELSHPIADRADLEGPVEKLLEDGLAFVRRNMRVAGLFDEQRDPATCVDVPEYPLIAVQEVITNALVHRDYSLRGSSPDSFFGWTGTPSCGKFKQVVITTTAKGVPDEQFTVASAVGARVDKDWDTVQQAAREQSGPTMSGAGGESKLSLRDVSLGVATPQQAIELGSEIAAYAAKRAGAPRHLL